MSNDQTTLVPIVRRSTTSRRWVEVPSSFSLIDAGKLITSDYPGWVIDLQWVTDFMFTGVLGKPDALTEDES